MKNFIIQEQGQTLLSLSTITPWRFKLKNGTFLDAALSLTSSSVHREGDFQIFSYEYTADQDALQAKRTIITAGEHTGFIVDQIHTKEAVSVHADFCFQNPNGTAWCNVPDKHRIVGRCQDLGFKHFRLEAQAGQNDILNSAGLLLPYRIDDQKNIHYSMYEGLYNYQHDHFTCYSYCTHRSDEIKTWHMKQIDDHYVVEPSKLYEGWIMTLNKDSITVYNKLNDAHKITAKLSPNPLCP